MDSSSHTPVFLPSPPTSTQWLISGDMLTAIRLVSRPLLITIATLGLITNIINVVVFLKIGLKSTTNICFFVLSIADFFTASYIFTLNFTAYIDWTYSPISLLLLVHAIMSQTANVSAAYSSWVKAIIAIERWFCVAYPLKVKKVFTRKSVIIMLLVAAVYEVTAIAPYFFSFVTMWVPIPNTNRSQLTVNRRKRNEKLGSLSRLMTFSIPNLICFCIVSVATALLINRLNTSKKQRETMTGGRTTVDSREAKIAKSVIFVCVIFIIGYSIKASRLVVDQVYPRMKINDPIMGNFTVVLTQFSHFLQTAASSVNIFVYLTMSSIYQTTFRKIFCQVQRIET